MNDADEIPGQIGSTEWLAGMKAIFACGLARLQSPPPPSPSLQMASYAAVGELVEIERELAKGPTASPVVVENADRLRKVYHDRLIVLSKLSRALDARGQDDELYASLDAINPVASNLRQGQSLAVDEGSPGVVPPHSGLMATTSEILLEAEEQPIVPGELSPTRATALDELRIAAKILNNIELAPSEQVRFVAQGRVVDALVGKIEGVVSAISPADTATQQAEENSLVPGLNYKEAGSSEPPSDDKRIGPLLNVKPSQNLEIRERLMSDRARAEAAALSSFERALVADIERISQLVKLESAWSAASLPVRADFLNRLTS